VWRAAGMLDLAVLSVFGFSGYAALLATAPLWAVNGGATAAGSGLVNGVLLTATVLAQLAVPRALVSWGTGRVLVAGLLLLGVPAPGYLLSDRLGWVLGLSAVRGLGFGILTVVGSTVVANLVPAGRRGAAIGVYGLSVAVPNLLLLPGSVPVVDRWGFGPVFWAAALPVLGVPSALRLARVLRGASQVRPVGVDEGSPVRSRALSGIVPPTVVLFSVTMAGGAVLTFAPQLTDSATAALVLLIMGITAAVSRWLIGALADRRGARPFLVPILTAEPHSGCGVRRRWAAATADRERRVEHWLRRRDGVRRRPRWCTRYGLFLSRLPRHVGRALPPHRRRSCRGPLSPTGQPSLAVGPGRPPRATSPARAAGTNRDRPGLQLALAACRSGDTFVVT
jgi:MFS family permease